MDWQTILSYAQLLLGPIGFILWQVAREQRRLGQEIAALNEWKANHQQADRDAHQRFETEAQDILVELRLARRESSEHHESLAAKLAEASKEGREGRRALHEKVDGISGDVQWLMGRADPERRK